MKKIIFYLLLIISFLNFSAEIKEKVFLLPDFITLKDAAPEYSYTFYVDNSWDLKESSLNLRVAQNQLKNYKDSTLTVFLNNIPVNSIELKNIKNNSDINLNINNYIIRSGFNTLKIKVFYKTEPGNCALDSSNTGNWLILSKSTGLKIKYDKLQNTDGLLNYPFTYVKEDGDLDAVIALPDNPDNDEIAAALTMALFLGRKAQFNNTPLKIINYSEIANTKSNIILISKPDKVDKPLLNFTSEESKAVESNQGLIKEVVTEDKRLLLILGKNKESLKNSVMVLTDENLYFQLKPVSNIIGNVVQPQYEKVSKSAFKDYSYENILLSGTSEKTAEYNFALDRNTEYDNVKIKINFRNSENLDYSVSEVITYVNNVPVANKKLEKLLSNGNSIEFSVPSDLIVKGNINLKVRFFLKTDGSNCDIGNEEDPWVFISKDSKVDVKYIERKQYRLGTYPGPFIKDYRLNDTGFVIPVNIDFDELNYLVNTAFYLGKNTKITDYVEVYNDIVKDKNLIVYGRSQEKYIKNLNDKLYLKYNKAFTNFEKNEKISFINDSNQIGTLQVVKEKNNEIIVVTAPNKSEAMLSLSYLAGNFADLRGDVMVVDESGKTKSFYYLDNINDLSDQQPVINYDLLALGIVVLFCFLLSIILIFIQKKGDKK